VVRDDRVDDDGRVVHWVELIHRIALSTTWNCHSSEDAGERPADFCQELVGYQWCWVDRYA
jgi:hypothetical protein